MKEKTCCFTGHRTIKKEELGTLKEKLEKEIIKLIENDVKFFICGGALGFDTYAALSILELKNIYKNIELIIAAPCREQNKNWSEKDKIVYQNILESADKIIYVSNEYTNNCMLKRNRYMVDNSQYCISYLRKNRTGTSYTINYAEKQNLKIISI